MEELTVEEALSRFNDLMGTVLELKRQGKEIESHKFYLRNIREISACNRVLDRIEQPV